MTNNLIIFEGPDSVGKSRLSREVAKKLRQNGRKCLLLSFPGKRKGSLGKLVYDLHHQPQQFGILKLTPAALQTMHVAAHLDALQRVIKPALAQGKIVILDRFWWSTVVYGAVYGIPRKILKAIVKPELQFLGNIHPTLAFLIHRDQPFIVKQTDEHWDGLMKEYIVLAKSQAKKHPVRYINNSGRLSKIVSKIVADIRRVTTS